MMGNKTKILVIVPALILSIGLALPAFAQDSNVPASTSMDQAGHNSADAVKNAYQGSVTAVDDTTITTAVKTNLAAARDLRSGQVHVTTVAGVVTLQGWMHDSVVISRAEAIARDTSGVRMVTNELQVDSSVPKD
jgi:hyperosmotically inducible periplasmic protein